MKATLSDAVEHWTGDRPDPARWLPTPSIEEARARVLAALARHERPILVCGPTGYGKTLLLRSLAARPPAGLAPLFVPFLTAEPGEVARWLLACCPGHARPGPGSDPEVDWMRWLRSHARRGERPLVLLDEGQASPPDAARRLLELFARSGADPALVVAALDGRRVPDAFASKQPIGLDTPWGDRELSDWLDRLAASAGVPARALFERIDVGAEVRDTRGNPRLLQARLATRLAGEHEALERCVRRESQDRRVEHEARPPAPARASRSAPSAAPAAARAPRNVPSAAPAAARASRGAPLRRDARPARRAAARRGAALAVFATAGILLLQGRPSWAPVAPRPSREGRVAEASVAMASVVSERRPEVAVHVNALPWAHVEVDGQAVGTTPLTLSLPPGRHHFRAVMVDGRSLERVVEVSAEHRHVGFR